MSSGSSAETAKDVRIKELEATVAEKDAALAQKDAALAQKDAALAQKDTALASALAQLDPEGEGGHVCGHCPDGGCLLVTALPSSDK